MILTKALATNLWAGPRGLPAKSSILSPAAVRRHRQAGLRFVFRALELFELLFAREGRVQLRGETLAFELVAVARSRFGYFVAGCCVKEGSGLLCAFDFRAAALRVGPRSVPS